MRTDGTLAHRVLNAVSANPERPSTREAIADRAQSTPTRVSVVLSGLKARGLVHNVTRGLWIRLDADGAA